MTQHSPDPAAQEETTATLAQHPFTILRPREQKYPFVFASPHSGRIYPSEFRAHSSLTATDLRRSEDAFADLLYHTGKLEAPWIQAEFPRAYIDVNRSPLEIDIDMFDGPLAFPTERTLHVVSGFGIIPRLIREGVPILQGQISPRELTTRIENFYFPYHRALSALMRETRTRFGHAILIDCHTMPDAAEISDVVLGDRYGTSAPPQLTRRAEISFAAEGFSVARNQPYAGGYTTEKFTRPDDHLYALQIEIRRTLYMDEDSLSLRPDFANVQYRVMSALTNLTRHYSASLRAANLRRAAE